MSIHCKHCGKETDGAPAHKDCARLHDEGWTDSQISAMRDGRANPLAAPVVEPQAAMVYYSYVRPLTFGQAIWAVILGSLIVGFIGWFIFLISH
jgi:hypothetical protein